MAERINGVDHSVQQIRTEMTFSVGEEELTRPVTHGFRPIVGNLALLTETDIPTETFEFLAARGKLGEKEVEGARYNTGSVVVQWEEPQIVEVDETTHSLRDPRGLVHPRLVEEIQRKYPTILSEWDTKDRVGRLENDQKYEYPNDLEIAMAIIDGTKPI